MPKMKSHSGAKKRFKITGTAKLRDTARIRAISLVKSPPRERED